MRYLLQQIILITYPILEDGQTANTPQIFQVSVNGVIRFDSAGKDLFVDFPSTTFESFDLPEFDTLNSNIVTAEEFKNILLDNINELAEFDQTGITKDDIDGLMSQFFIDFNRFNSQLFDSAKFVDVTDDNGLVVGSIPFIPPSFPTRLENISETEGVTFDPTYGTFDFDSRFSKYDIISVSLLGTSIENAGDNNHEEIEDKIEQLNSGLDSALATVKQTNNLKMGIYLEKQFEGEQEELSKPHQARYVVPRSEDFYTTLNSSVNYELDNSIDNFNGFNITHVSDAKHIESLNIILVAGLGGILSIDTDNIEILQIAMPDQESNYYKSIFVGEEKIYVVNDSQIYSSPTDKLDFQPVDRSGLPSGLSSISQISGTLVVGTGSGIYYKISDESTWILSVESENIVDTIISPDVMFAIDNDDVLLSANGSFFASANYRQNMKIRDISKRGAIIYAATENGLYKDDLTFYSDSARLSLVDIFSDRTLSSQYPMNTVISKNEVVFAGADNGSLVVEDDDKYLVIDNIPLRSIHQIGFCR